jgi:hypothetical protein
MKMITEDQDLELLGRVDPAIKHAVAVLRSYGVETFESCQGGEGHAYPEPTVRLRIPLTRRRSFPVTSKLLLELAD